MTGLLKDLVELCLLMLLIEFNKQPFVVQQRYHVLGFCIHFTFILFFAVIEKIFVVSNDIKAT